MYPLVKEELIMKFLNYYSIDYSLLSMYEKSVISLLSNIVFILFWFIILYVLYRFVCRLLGI